MDGLLVRADKPPAPDQHQPGDTPFLRDIQLCDRFLITKSRLPYIHRSLHSHVIRVRVVGDFCRGDTSCGPPENGSCASDSSAIASPVGFPGGLPCGDRGNYRDHPGLTSTYGPFCLVADTEVRGMVVAPEVPARSLAVPPRWRIGLIGMIGCCDALFRRGFAGISGVAAVPGFRAGFAAAGSHHATGRFDLPALSIAARHFQPERVTRRSPWNHRRHYTRAPVVLDRRWSWRWCEGW
jgi:hypothetical protein